MYVKKCMAMKIVQWFNAYATDNIMNAIQSTAQNIYFF